MATSQPFNPIHLLVSGLRSALLAGAVLFATSGAVQAQSFIVATLEGGAAGAGKVRSYTLAGSPVNLNLITGQTYPIDLAVTPAHIYVVNRDANSIGQYNHDGTVVNASLITGLNSPKAIAIQGSDIYVADSMNNRIGKYTTAGATVNASFITFSGPVNGVAVSGNDLYASVDGPIGAGLLSSVQKFTTAGVLLNNSLITGLIQPMKMAVSGSDLFLIHGSTLSVGKYDTTTGAGGILFQGGIGGSQISVPTDLVISGSNLYVASLGDIPTSLPSKIGHYTTSGAIVNADLITGVNSPYALEIVTPPNLTIGCYTGLTVTGPVGSTYTIQYTNSMTPPVTWTTLTTGTLTTGSFFYIDTSAPAGSRFYQAIVQ